MRVRRRGLHARTIQSGIRRGLIPKLGQKRTAKDAADSAKAIQAMRDSAAATERSMRERGEL